MTSLPRCRLCGQPLEVYLTERYCQHCDSYRITRPSFEQWMAEVDEVLVKKVGVSSADLPDWTYRDAFDQGSTPEEAADEAIENSMS
jgi:Family of unknown function (DUF5419)